ncbi:MAG: hypothetical protein AB1813_07280 [Verrucomicrobiota bacterium]
MKQTRLTYFLFGLLISVFCSNYCRAAEGVPPLINYQGKLTDAQGQPLPNGNYRLAFRLWSDPSSTESSALVWGREFEVTVVDGLFNVILNDNGQAVDPTLPTALPDAFAGSNRFLGLTILRTPAATIPTDQRREILPRQQILSVPFAMQAQTAMRAQAAASVEPNSVGAAAIQDGSVSVTKLAPRLVGKEAVLGGVALSPIVNVEPVEGGAAPEQLKVTITTSGRPVFVMLQSGGGVGRLERARSVRNDAAQCEIVRNGKQVSNSIFTVAPDGTTSQLSVAPSSISVVDFPSAGVHEYSARGWNIGFIDVQLVAFEL